MLHVCGPFEGVAELVCMSVFLPRLHQRAVGSAGCLRCFAHGFLSLVKASIASRTYSALKLRISPGLSAHSPAERPLSKASRITLRSSLIVIFMAFWGGE